MDSMGCTGILRCLYFICETIIKGLSNWEGVREDIGKAGERRRGEWYSYIFKL